MILIDFSSIVHRMIFSSVKLAKPTIAVNNKLDTSKFIQLTKHLILDELFNIKQSHEKKFGEMVICLDDKDDKRGYWRKDVYAQYKSTRKTGRDESNIDYTEVFKHVNELIEQLVKNVPWKVIVVPRAEADDSMLILSRFYCSSENILIHSPDKDMIQAQRFTDRVFQWSALGKKWLVAEHKSGSMENWVMEHCVLGDASDGVPKVVEHTEFSDTFKSFVGDNSITPETFENVELFESFDVFKTNRRGESTGIKDIFKGVRFGASTLKKELSKHDSFDDWLDSNPLYRKHYNRNFTLVMEEGIPKYISLDILNAYKVASVEYKQGDFSLYLKENKLNSILMTLPNHFKLGGELSMESFGW